jgi:hypothetical protein
MWQRKFKRAWGPMALMPDTVLTKLASLARLKTVADIKATIPEWMWADEFGEEILELLRK